MWDDRLPPGVDPYRTLYTFSDQANWLHVLVMAAGIMFVIFAMVILVMVVSWP